MPSHRVLLPMKESDMEVTSTLIEHLPRIFGSPNDPMPLLEERANIFLPDQRWIIWEGDATNFQFLYVSDSAVELLGYEKEDWYRSPTFWADIVVHPQDRDYAVSYCALATGQGQDHDFIYRAQAADGRILHLHDYVRVILGPRRFATHLRGLMIDVTGHAPDPENLS